MCRPICCTTIVHFSDPPDGDPFIHGTKGLQPLFLYEGDLYEMTCEIVGGLPLANLSLECPELNTSTGGNQTQVWDTASGEVTRSLKEKQCICTAQHYAWLGVQNRTVMSPEIHVFCKYKDCPLWLRTTFQKYDA